MKKVISLLLIMAFSIMLIGCETDGTSTGSSVSLTDPYLGGEAKGLDIKFEAPFGMEQNAVDEVYDDSTFDIELSIINKGEYNVKKDDIQINLSGINPDLFNNFDKVDFNKNNIKGIESKTENFEDEINVVIKEDVNYIFNTDDKFKHVNANFRADVCYKYETYATSKLCFKSRKNKREGCDIEGIKPVYNSAAPIKVKSIEQVPTSAGGKIIIEVENAGTGVPYTYNKSESRCDPDIKSKEDRALLYLTLPGGNGGCEGKEIRFNGNVGKVYCEFTIDENDNFEQAIEMTIQYDYAVTENHVVKIINSNAE